MKLRTSKPAPKGRTVRPELMRLEDRVVPGEVLGTAMCWAMGSLGYPVLLAQDDATAQPAPAVAVDAGFAADEASTSLTLCQVDGALDDTPDDWPAGPIMCAGDLPASAGLNEALDRVFLNLATDFDLGDTADAASHGVIPNSPLNSDSLGQAAAGASAAGAYVAPSVSTSTGTSAGFSSSAQTGNITETMATSMAGDAGGGERVAAAHATASASLNLPAVSAATSEAPADSGGNAEPMYTAHPTAAPAAGPQTNAPAPYSPAQIRHAYGFDQLSNQGSGQTIYIVDAYNDPNISRDLQTFDTQWGLPNPTLTVHKMSNRVRNSVSWGLEESLDVEWAHAIAPQANITLVEATSASTSNLYAAVDWATNNGAHVVSMSWGGGDGSGESSLDSHFNHSGVSYVASAGDSGGVVEYPSASPYVLSVGGTSLTIDTNSNYVSESAWSSGGGGASVGESEPAYQRNYGISLSGRGTPDVSYNGDPNTGVYVYDSYTYQPGWYEVGGTSAGAPQWAALIALANQSRGTPLSTNNLTSRTEYNAATGSVYATNYHDVTTGSNGYAAGTGYDLATGVGSPQANNLVPWLISNN